MTKHPEAFKLAVPDADIADLRERLKRTRFPDQAPGPAWAYGTDVAWLRNLTNYWGEQFDWRAQEARLNVFPQYKVHLDDIDLHFLHVEGEGPDPCGLFGIEPHALNSPRIVGATLMVCGIALVARF
jgi:microsomal epoxide hydrolase